MNAPVTPPPRERDWHEILATVLLLTEGAAEFRRGTVHILNADRLDKASCECLVTDREALEPARAPAVDPIHRLPRNIPRTAMGLIRPEIRRAR